MTATHVNQHWIPRVYLKGWVEPNAQGNRIHRYRADGSYKDWRPITRVFSENDIYTTTGPDGERDLCTEEGLQELEHLFEKCREALEGKRDIALENLTALRFSIAAMRNRSPAARDHWQGFLDEVTNLGREFEAALRSTSPAQQRAMAASPTLGGRGASLTLDEWQDAANRPFGAWLPNHIMLEAEGLMRMSLRILRAPEGSSFITSDNPVTWWDADDPQGHGRRALGLNYPHLEITMPITPALCAVLFHSDDEDIEGFSDVDALAVDQINARTLASCNEFWVADRDDLVVDWLLTDVEADGQRN